MMSINKLVFINSLYPEKEFQELKLKNSISITKFNKLIVKGFVQNGFIVSNFATFYKKELVIKESYILENGIKYYLHMDTRKTTKLINRINFLVKTLYNEIDDSSIVLCDYLNYVKTIVAYIVCKKKKVPIIAIVTDLPEYIGDYAFKKQHTLYESIYVFFGNFLLKRMDGYVFLTEEMNKKINIKNKKYIKLEGLIDSDIKINQVLAKNKIILYAGSLHKEYGIVELIEGFQLIKNDKIELHLYGAGNFGKEIEDLSKVDKRIKYFGLVENQILMNNMKNVSILINPRPTNYEYTKYSFPSKNMEYMSTGIPFITTNLTGMNEYKDYVTFIENENPVGIANAIDEVLSNYDIAKTKAGKLKEYMLAYKNESESAKKITKLFFEIKE